MSPNRPIKSPVPPTLHEAFDEDEARLRDSASNELWTNVLMDRVMDVASPLLNAATWDGLPAGTPRGWDKQSTAALALAAIAVRSTRALTLLVRSGYAPEALPHLRRLMEAAGHAQRVASDVDGTYSLDWIEGRGKSLSNRKAFGGDPREKAFWDLMSGQAHASFRGHARILASVDNNRVAHRLNPARDARWDSVWLWMAARQLGRVLACVLKVHPDVDESDYLIIMSEVVQAEQRIDTELAAESKGSNEPDSAGTSGAVLPQEVEPGSDP